MSQLVRRLSYSIPLLLIGSLLAVENLAPLPYVFDKGVGAVSGVYFKVFKSESLRYSKALILASQGVKAAAGGGDAKKAAAANLREAGELIAEVHRAWAFDRVGKGLNGDEFDQFKADLPVAAGALEKGAESPELARVAKYVDSARTLLPNGSIL